MSRLAKKRRRDPTPQLCFARRFVNLVFTYQVLLLLGPQAHILTLDFEYNFSKCGSVQYMKNPTAAPGCSIKLLSIRYRGFTSNFLIHLYFLSFILRTSFPLPFWPFVPRSGNLPLSCAGMSGFNSFKSQPSDPCLCRWHN